MYKHFALQVCKQFFMKNDHWPWMCDIGLAAYHMGCVMKALPIDVHLHGDDKLATALPCKGETQVDEAEGIVLWSVISYIIFMVHLL